MYVLTSDSLRVLNLSFDGGGGRTDFQALSLISINFRREKKHFNMVELLKAEEKKKKGGIGVAKTAKPKEEQQVKREREEVRHDKERKRAIKTV